MFADLLQRLASATRCAVRALHRHLLAATRPPLAPLVAGTLADLPRTKPELLLENALLRQQVIILRRGVRRPRCTPTDRALLVLLASRLRTWRQALLIVQPDTLCWPKRPTAQPTATASPLWRRKIRTPARTWAVAGIAEVRWYVSASGTSGTGGQRATLGSSTHAIGACPLVHRRRLMPKLC